jgi:hypothetical protein
MQIYNFPNNDLKLMAKDLGLLESVVLSPESGSANL